MGLLALHRRFIQNWMINIHCFGILLFYNKDKYKPVYFITKLIILLDYIDLTLVMYGHSLSQHWNGNIFSNHTKTIC